MKGRIKKLLLNIETNGTLVTHLVYFENIHIQTYVDMLCWVSCNCLCPTPTPLPNHPHPNPCPTTHHYQQPTTYHPHSHCPHPHTVYRCIILTMCMPLDTSSISCGEFVGQKYNHHFISLFMASR